MPDVIYCMRVKLVLRMLDVLYICHVQRKGRLMFTMSLGNLFRLNDFW